MDTLCLKNYGVSEMKTKEMRKASGGWWYRAVRAVLVAYAAVNESCGNCLNNSITDQVNHVGSSNGGKYGGAFQY